LPLDFLYHADKMVITKQDAQRIRGLGLSVLAPRREGAEIKAAASNTPRTTYNDEEKRTVAHPQNSSGPGRRRVDLSREISTHDSDDDYGEISVSVLALYGTTVSSIKRKEPYTDDEQLSVQRMKPVDIIDLTADVVQ